MRFQGRGQGGSVGAPAPTLFGPQKSKGKIFPIFMKQIFKNVEFCGKKGKKNKKNLRKGQNFFAPHLQKSWLRPWFLYTIRNT